MRRVLAALILISALPCFGQSAAPLSQSAGPLAEQTLTVSSITGITASRLLGRGSAGGTGAAQEITPGTGLTISGTTLTPDVSGSGAAGRLALWSSASGLTSDAGLTYSGTGTGTVLRIGSAGTGLSEISAGVLGVGTGAAGSAAGTVVADRHAIWGSTDTYIGYSGGQNAGSVILAESATPVLAIGANAGANILGLMLASGYRLSWGTIGGLPNLFLSRRAAATLQLGAADSATPVAQTLAFQGSRGGTDTNTAGADATIQGSLGTGSAASGKIVFKVGTPNASGSTQHTPNTVLTLQDTGTGGTASPAVISAGPITSPQYRLSALNTAPSSATDTGTLGEIRIAADYIYVCVATDTWVRAALATWP